MNDSMSTPAGPRRPRFLILLLVVTALALGALAYNVGLRDGAARAAVVAAQAAQVAQPGTTPPGVAPSPMPLYPYAYPYGGYGWHGPHYGFGFLPILGLFFLFFALRAAFWGGPWRRWGYCGPGPGPGRYLDEWHRQAHARTEAPPSSERTNDGPADAART